MKIAILGLGKTGLSVYQHYNMLGYEITVWDDSISTRSQLKDIYNFQEYEYWNYSKLDFIVVSPGIALYHPSEHYIVKMSIQYKVPIYCDIELFMQENLNKKYIGITGTNGKSTTTALITHIFQQAGLRAIAAGNIGIPVFDVNPAEVDFIIIELSSYQLELMNKYKFDCALLLNIDEDHMDHHGSFANYQNTKYKIFNYQTSKDLAIIDNSLLKEVDILNNSITPVLSVYQDNKGCSNMSIKGIHITFSEIIDNYFQEQGVCISCNDIVHLKGDHNYQNIAFAYACAMFFGIKQTTIRKAVLSFKGLKHRQNQVRQIGKIVFINDSKATNPESTLQALKAFDNIYLILGGIPKRNNIDILLPFFSKVKCSLLIGESTNLFTSILQKNNYNFIACKDLKEATERAYQLAKQELNESTVLLSPACASFDQFSSFEHRGDIFIEIVENLQ